MSTHPLIFWDIYFAETCEEPVREGLHELSSGNQRKGKEMHTERSLGMETVAETG